MKRIHKIRLLLIALGTGFAFANLKANEPAEFYGANPSAAHFLRVADAQIYYETYGNGGTPLVLLHGGLYGYIDEFSGLIREMASHRRVIAIATRGHGKSEIGRQGFSFALFANDALSVIRAETNQKVDLLGFSEGALTSYQLASAHPEIIRRLVAIGGSRGTRDWTAKALYEFENSKASDVEKNDPQFVAERRRLMPEPGRWIEFVTRINKLEDVHSIITDQQIRSIEAPTLLIAGDHDPYNQTEKFVEIFHLLRFGQLLIVPGCGHLVLYHESALATEVIEKFLDQSKQ
jgi:pimeloyl-ACP methyl ester carboxylesterase